MSSLRRALTAALGFTATMSLLHAWLNLDLLRRETGEKPLKIGFLPVT